MKLDLTIDGQDANEITLLDLEDWIRAEGVPSLRVSPRKRAAKPDDMGVEWLAGLEVILATQAVVMLVKALHVWLKERKKRISVTIAHRGRSISISADNLPTITQLCDDVTRLL